MYVLVKLGMQMQTYKHNDLYIYKHMYIYLTYICYNYIYIYIYTYVYIHIVLVLISSVNRPVRSCLPSAIEFRSTGRCDRNYVPPRKKTYKKRSGFNELLLKVFGPPFLWGCCSLSNKRWGGCLFRR